MQITAYPNQIEIVKNLDGSATFKLYEQSGGVVFTLTRNTFERLLAALRSGRFEDRFACTVECE